MNNPESGTSLPVRQAPRSRDAFTIVELLVASALGLIAMAGVASLFGLLGRGVSQSQALVELNGRMRNAAWQLRQDLTGLTAPSAQWVRPEANAGYIDIVEGSGSTSATNLIGDVDDTLSLSTATLGERFTGRLQGAEGFESPTAEVAWFCEPSASSYQGQQLFDLHRRQLLVAATPAAGSFQTGVTVPFTDWNTFFLATDISCRSVGSRAFANSLGDLTTRANRVLVAAATARKLTGVRQGEDVILTNVIAFDVQPWNGTAYADVSFGTQYTEGANPPASITWLRGLRVRIRCVEPSSGQVRQITVVQSF